MESSRCHPLFRNQVEAHPVEELVFLQHDQSDGIHLLHVKVELHASRRVAKEVPPVLRDGKMKKKLFIQKTLALKFLSGCWRILLSDWSEGVEKVLFIQDFSEGVSSFRALEQLEVFKQGSLWVHQQQTPGSPPPTVPTLMDWHYSTVTHIPTC